MKRCPYCAEEIEEKTEKCNFCGALLQEEGVPRRKWYFRTSFLIVAFLGIGPLALPLLWFNPYLSRKSKLVTTGVIVIITYFLARIVASSLRVIFQYYNLVFQQLK